MDDCESDCGSDCDRDGFAAAALSAARLSMAASDKKVVVVAVAVAVVNETPLRPLFNRQSRNDSPRTNRRTRYRLQRQPVEQRAVQPHWLAGIKGGTDAGGTASRSENRLREYKEWQF